MRHCASSAAGEGRYERRDPAGAAGALLHRAPPHTAPGNVSVSSWGSTRRFTSAAAAKSIRESIVNATPMSELLPKIQSLTKRELGKLEVAAALRYAGFEFDGE